MRLGQRQALAVLNHKINQQLSSNHYGVQDANSAADGYIRESILNSATNGKARILLDGGVLVINSHGSLIVIRPEGDLMQVTARFSGTEEFDGEDAGTKTFFMNRQSLQGSFRDAIVKIPRAVDAIEFLNTLRP